MGKNLIMNKLKYIKCVSYIMNTTSVPWYILWNCMKYNEYGKAYALYLFLQCHTDERHSNHFSFATITSNNPFCEGSTSVQVSAE